MIVVGLLVLLSLFSLSSNSLFVVKVIKPTGCTVIKIKMFGEVISSPQTQSGSAGFLLSIKCGLSGAFPELMLYSFVATLYNNLPPCDHSWGNFAPFDVLHLGQAITKFSGPLEPPLASGIT